MSCGAEVDSRFNGSSFYGDYSVVSPHSALSRPHILLLSPGPMWSRFSIQLQVRFVSTALYSQAFRVTIVEADTGRTKEEK